LSSLEMVAPCARLLSALFGAASVFSSSWVLPTRERRDAFDEPFVEP
jgi:hypothetical protein